MHGLGHRLRRAARFAWKNGDALIAITLAFGVAIAEVVGDPSPHVVDAAILILLGTTAFVLLRDRDSRGELEELRGLAKDAIADRPYVVVSQSNHWDIRDRHRAMVTKTEQIRFTRNDVATNFQWSSGDGTIERNVAKWRRDSRSAWIPAKKIYEFSVRGGMKVIYCFDEEHNQGDMLDWCVEREMLDRFPSDHEGIEILGRTKSDHPREIRITWPRDAPPSHVEIRQGARPARTLQPRRRDGRLFVEEKIAGLAIGETVRIDWTW